MAYALHIMSLQTPVDAIIVEADDEMVTAIRIGEKTVALEAAAAPANALAVAAAQQIREYFEGKRRTFDVPLAPLPSERGMALRRGITDIGFGETITYGALARQLGSAPRAVGQACRRNPFPIIIPCHRVTSSAGPEYYSGGDGPQTKAWLIEFEARTLGHRSRFL
jgi:methylated-DNA-[protein]-cysteine S-methyltransferase